MHGGMEENAAFVAEAFLKKHNHSADELPKGECLQRLLREMEQGLAGEGIIPMLPSFLSTDIRPAPNERCWILDAGGTNLRSASAFFDDAGKCHIEQLRVIPMPGAEGELTKEAFYETVASQLLWRETAEKVGFCFSYNVDMNRNLDGTLLAWCKEVRVPEAVGCPVGASLKQALGNENRAIRVLNDSTAALLGEEGADVALILGTGINVCYSERCENIPKVPSGLRGETMIISTEVGAFDGIPKGDFDLQVITGSDIPEEAHAEKQCSGAYLGEIVSLAWRAAAAEGILSESFACCGSDLSQISGYLAGSRETGIPENETARQIAAGIVRRAAKIAAVLTAGCVVRSLVEDRPVRIAVEGSTFWKLTGFQQQFCEELSELLVPYGKEFSIIRTENACLIGAARAAFAQTM